MTKALVHEAFCEGAGQQTVGKKFVYQFKIVLHSITEIFQELQ